MSDRTRKWTRGGICLIAFLVLAPVLFVEFGQRRPVPPALSTPLEPGLYSVYVADWGYHSSIILQQPPGWTIGPADLPTAAYVEFAWGNRAYYMSVHPSVVAGLAALLIPSNSVTYVAGWATAADLLRAGARRILVRRVSGATLQALAADLEATLDRRVQFPSVPGYVGRFYASSVRYLWWYDCNRWTVDRLAHSGLATSGRGVLFSWQVAGRLRGFESAAPRQR
jgi:hypothetical protein